MNDHQPVVALRLAPPSSKLRPERLSELTRVIGSQPLVGDIHVRDAAVIIEEAKNLNADVIVLDSPGTIGTELAELASQQDIAVVIAPNTALGRDSSGRQTSMFHGYERYLANGTLEHIEDGALKREIESRRRHR